MPQDRSQQVNSNRQEVRIEGTSVIITNTHVNTVTFESEENAQKFFEIQQELSDLQNEVSVMQEQMSLVYEKMNALQRVSYTLIGDNADDEDLD